MNHPCPAQQGMPVSQVETPALLLDMDAFERNLSVMSDELSGSGVALRAHAKAHKCPGISNRQIAAGAIGVWCQKVSEAEVLVGAGLTNVLVTNEIIAPVKLARLCVLAGRADVAVLCDNPLAVAALASSAEDAGIVLRVLVEIVAGGPRCGVAPGEDAAQLAQLSDRSPSLEFAGLQAYCGSAQHKRRYDERELASRKVVEAVKLTKSALSSRGLDRELVSGGGTGTYRFERDSGVFTEVQAGSYAFLDMDYAKILDENGEPVQIFQHSLFVLATVISRPAEGRAILDVGHKAHSVDSGQAGIVGISGACVSGQSDEHMVVEFEDGGPEPQIGETVRLIPGHVDPTFNLHDWVVCIRGGNVEDVWPISARGPGL